MIIFPELGQKGRLGNVLFQYAATKALALERGVESKLPWDIDTRVWHNQPCLLKHFKITDSRYSPSELAQVKNSYVLPGDYQQRNYEEFWRLPVNTKLYGHFESEFYFKRHSEEVRKQLEFNDDIETHAKEYLEKVRCKYDGEIVAVHIRRRSDDILDKDSTDANINFINESITTYFPTNCIFLVFCGGSRENTTKDDITRYRQYLPSDKFIFCEIDDTIRELCIIKNCDHAIGYEYSTFFWWGAYLNKNINKRIIVPKKLSPGGTPFNPDVFWSDDFIKV
jgi:hypothetical protein